MGCSSGKVKSEVKTAVKDAVNSNKNNNNGTTDNKNNERKKEDETKKVVENKMDSNQNKQDNENNQNDQPKEDKDGGDWESNKNKISKDVQDQVNRFESKISDKAVEVEEKNDANLPGKARDSKPQIVFTVSAPGTNKLDVVYSKLKDLEFQKISVKDLLKEHSASGGEIADTIKDNFLKKTFVPADIVIDILSEYIDTQFKQGNSRFLIGGFPRCEDNSKTWKKKIGDKYNVVALIFFSYTRKEYEIEMEEKRKETGEEMSFEERMKKYEDYLMNTKEVDDDFGTKKMIKYSAKLADETLADEIYDHNLFNPLRIE